MIKIMEDGTVVYENEPQSPRDLLPNTSEGASEDEITALIEAMTGLKACTWSIIG